MNEIEQSLNETIDSSNLEGLTADLGEIALDSLLEDGILKEIPVFGSIVKVAKLGANLSDFLLYKKVYKFLFQIKEIPLDQRKKFYSDIITSNEYNKNIGEALLFILDKLDDIQKPEIIGKLFAATLIGKLSYKDFLRLSYIIGRIFIPDIYELRNLRTGMSVENESKSNLYNLGLMSRNTFGEIKVDGSNEYYINYYGEKLVDLLFE